MIPPSLAAIERAPLDAPTRAARLKSEADRLGLELVFAGGVLVDARPRQAATLPGTARGDSRYG